jgi:hypothetical protein
LVFGGGSARALEDVDRLNRRLALRAFPHSTCPLSPRTSPRARPRSPHAADHSEQSGDCLARSPAGPSARAEPFALGPLAKALQASVHHADRVDGVPRSGWHLPRAIRLVLPRPSPLSPRGSGDQRWCPPYVGTARPHLAGAPRHRADASECLLARGSRFAEDSPLEEGGFETSVPRHG